MKKVLIPIIILLVINNVYSEILENKYSTELGSEEPMTYRVTDYLKWAEEDIDLLKYKTIIRNGIIEEIEEPYLNDLQLGALTKTELKLFRNLFYAKKGYIFNDEDLTRFYSQFDWYKPKTKDVSFSTREKSAIDRIKIFEAESTIKYEFENKNIIWEVWNGGADQRGPLFKINKDKSFEYIPSESINRIKSISGTWEIKNNRLILTVTTEKILMGGYVALHPNTPYIDKASPAIIKFEEPVIISLPLNESEAYKKYNLNWSEKWMMIGSSDCYISK